MRPDRSLVRRAERHQRLGSTVTALALYVVTRDQASEAVADDVDAVVAGLVAHALDVLTEIGGPPGAVVEPRAVVTRTHARATTPPEAAAHHREDRPVVHETGHQQHRD